MRTHDLAQLNIAKLLHPLDSPYLQDFVDNLDRINALAESSDGFVWRLQSDSGNATDIDYFGPDMIVNMSTWADAKALHHFVYRTAHAQFIKRRKEWFDELKFYNVLWWVPTGTEPTIEEAHKRLQLLEEHGPTEQAFLLSHLFKAT